MLCAVGDLIEDVVVQLHDTIRRDSDTPATIVRRRGGSAANVAYFAAKLSGRSRFVGCVGSDPLGDSLVAQLTKHHVDVRGERRGRTGSIVVVATSDGERTMLTDRGDATSLATANEEWLADITVLHLPLYSFSSNPIATTARALAVSARARGVIVSVDLSSVTLIQELSTATVHELLNDVCPDVLFCTRAEADAAHITSHDRAGAELVVVKDGSRPVYVFGAKQPSAMFAVVPVDHVVDGTGAGDAFAAGFLQQFACAESVAACVEHGNVLAARVVTRAGATLEDA